MTVKTKADGRLMMSGRFIVFEGGEGAGKSSQARRLHTRLSDAGYRTVLLRDPGSTELGDYLRAYLNSDRPLSDNAELLLFAAARAELTATVIMPHLAAGAVVIADRFASSTVAYQGYGRGLNRQQIDWLNDFATAGRYPDLTILLDLDPAVGLERVRSRAMAQTGSGTVSDAEGNRFEDAELAFHRAVRQGFRELAQGRPDAWHIIDAGAGAAEVTAQVWDAVAPLLPI